MDIKDENRDENRDGEPVSPGRFQKGVSGNPAGRPRKVETDLDSLSPEELASLGDETLRRVMVSSRAAESAKVQAAKEWNRRQALVPDATFDWRQSVQVRPDYEPPSWSDVLEFARAIGAF